MPANNVECTRHQFTYKDLRYKENTLNLKIMYFIVDCSISSHYLYYQYVRKIQVEIKKKVFKGALKKRKGHNDIGIG